MSAPTKATSLLQNVRKGFEHLKGNATGSHTLSLDSPASDVRLPSEILIAVFSLLQLYDLFVCRRASKSFCHIIDNVPEIQYLIELQIAGLAPTSRDKHFGHDEKILALREIQARRARKQIIEDASLPVYPLGERSGDVFCHPYSTAENDDTYFSNAIRCVSIVGRGPGEQPIAKCWDLTFYAGFGRLCADSEQDLLILMRPTGLMVELPESFQRVWVPSIRVLSLQDGTPRTPGIEAISAAGSSCLDGYERCRIRGSVLGLIQCRHDADLWGPGAPNHGVVEVVIIDWTKGIITARLLHRGSLQDAPLSVDVFAFVSENVFLLAVDRGHAIAIEVFAFGYNGSVQSFAESVPESPCHVATYELPEWLPGCQVVSQAVMGCTFQNGGRNRTFKSSAESALVILGNVQIQSRAEWRTHARILWFVMQANTFLDCVNMREVKSGRLPVIRSWATWGPASTRCFEFNAIRGTIPCAVQGPRVLVKDKPAPKDNPSLHKDKYLHGYIFDFNLLPYRRLSVKDVKKHKLFRSTHSSGRTIQGPSVLARQGVFLKDVVTRLPYYQIPVEWPSQFSKTAPSEPPATDTPETSEIPIVSEVWVFAHADRAGLEYHALTL